MLPPDDYLKSQLLDMLPDHCTRFRLNSVQLAQVLGTSINAIDRYLEELVDEGKAEVVGGFGFRLNSALWP